MSGKKVFIVGPGFIGWNVLDLLIAESYTVSGLVRRDSHAQQILSSGATPIIGDLNDKRKITQHTFSADIVIHTATADHLPSVEAILDGIRARAEKGLKTIFIHTSGTSVLDDNAKGKARGGKIYSDLRPEEIDALPESAPHRKIDLAIVKCKRELEEKYGKGRGDGVAIMIPPLIYGFNPAHSRLTIQIPTLTRFALSQGYAPQIGAGLAVESQIHVLDLARAYIVLLHHLESPSSSADLKNPYYFCESTGDNEPSWHDIAATIGSALHSRGLVEDAQSRTVPEKEYGKLFGEFTDAVVGLNSRSRAERLRGLGWRPREKGWKESYLGEELAKILEEGVEGFGGYGGTVAS